MAHSHIGANTLPQPTSTRSTEAPSVIEVWRARGLHWGRASGRLTPEALGSMLAAQPRALDDWSAQGQVVLLGELAQPKEGAEALADRVAAIAQDRLTPVALVVSEDQLPYWLAHVCAAGHHGLLRGLFSGVAGPLSAAAWVMRMAQVVEVMRPDRQVSPMPSTSPLQSRARAELAPA